VDTNGWNARPWHLPEEYHFSNWCATMACEFLERRDPTVPFFLKVSFIHPHQPCTPPPYYWDLYMDMELPEPYVGDWARVFDEPQRGQAVASWRTCLEPALARQMRAGYYGAITHIDHQIHRILEVVPRNTIVLFLADHGEMLGDHQWIRKRSAYEPSARIPFVLRLPPGMGIEGGREVHELVELMDVMPTLLEAAGAPIPETVDGRSLLPLLRGDAADWRPYLHGECAEVPEAGGTGMQYLTDGRRKYIWHPGTGVEQYFDLEADPREMHDLAADPDRADEVAGWRGRLVEELEGRPEGFVESGHLRVLGRMTPFCLPGYERDGGERGI
jgi:arylsulfatase A-like enzyme